MPCRSIADTVQRLYPYMERKRARLLFAIQQTSLVGLHRNNLEGDASSLLATTTSRTTTKPPTRIKTARREYIAHPPKKNMKKHLKNTIASTVVLSCFRFSNEPNPNREEFNTNLLGDRYAPQEGVLSALRTIFHKKIHPPEYICQKHAVNKKTDRSPSSRSCC